MDDASVRAAGEDDVHAVLKMYESLFEPPGYTPRSWDPNRARDSLSKAIAGQQSTVMIAQA